MSNALIVVDVQSYFMQKAPADLPERITKHISAVSYDNIIFTVFKNQPESNFVKSMKWDLCSTDSDCVLPDEFSSLITTNNVFTRAKYSAFKTTKLHEYLQDNDVERVVFCGVDSDACVLATAYEAFDLGYHVKIEHALTHSANNLKTEAQLIMDKTIVSRD